MAAPKGNKYGLGNSGLPKKWKDAEELQLAIDGYFNECNERTVQIYSKAAQDIIDIKKPLPYTIEGLCDTLECERQTLLNYENKKGYEEFFDTIKRAKMKVQRNKMERGLEGDSNSAVTIFDLKNNHNYTDKTEITQDLNLKQDISNLTTEELIKRANAIKIIDEQS